MVDAHIADSTNGFGQQSASVASHAAGSLPQSPCGSTKQSRGNFESAVNRIKQDLPHLKNVLEPSRYQRSWISVFDYSSDMATLSWNQLSAHSVRYVSRYNLRNYAVITPNLISI
jgi:hypothetical protein